MCHRLPGQRKEVTEERRRDSFLLFREGELCPGHAGALRFVPRRAGALRVTDVGTGGGGGRYKCWGVGGVPCEVLYGPWDTKKALAPRGGRKGTGRGWSRRVVQTAFTIEVR